MGAGVPPDAGFVAEDHVADHRGIWGDPGVTPELAEDHGGAHGALLLVVVGVAGQLEALREALTGLDQARVFDRDVIREWHIGRGVPWDTLRASHGRGRRRQQPHEGERDPT